jgi:hypothetical protein
VNWKKQLRKRFSEKAVSLLADPRVAALLQDPRVTQGIVRAFTLKAQLEKSLDAAGQQLAKRLHLASSSELQELRRAVSRLERQLELARHEEAEIAADSRVLS